MLTPPLDDRGFQQHIGQLRIQHRRRHGGAFPPAEAPSPFAAPGVDAAG